MNETERNKNNDRVSALPGYGGSGYVKDNEQTNKDLIQSASTEQLVDELFRFWMEIIYHSEFELREEEIEFVKLKIKTWLKQPHKGG